MDSKRIEDIYELSPLQEGMLFHTLYEPDSRMYFEQVVIPFEGTVGRTAFEGAWNAVADASTALRTSFHWQETDKPVQVVHRKVTVPVQIIDIRHVPAASREKQVQSLLAADRLHGFDLQSPPLLRVSLLQLATTTYRLVLTFHHVILDGWSLQHIFRQFSEAYQLLALGRTPTLSRSRPYADYIRWLQKQDLDTARKYWIRVLSGLEGACRLPLQPNGASGDGASFSEHETALPTEATSRVREYAARHKLTVNTVVQGAWGLLIHRLTGCEDVVFGVTVSGRPAELKDVEQMVGLFINTVPLRLPIDLGSDVAKWLQALQSDQFEARQFDYSPLVKVREWCGASANGQLFDTLLAFENYPVQAGGISGPAPATFVERTNYPLSAAVVPGDRLHIRLLYDARVLTSAAVVHIGEQLELILQSLASSDCQTLGSLDTLTQADRELLSSVNATRTTYPSESTLSELWSQQAALSASDTALEFGTRRLAYAEVDRVTSRLASRLRTMGVTRETLVGVLLPRSVEFVISVLAVVKAGGTYVPIDTAYPSARVAGIVRNSGVRLLLTNSHIRQHCSAVEGTVAIVDQLLAEVVDDPVEAPDSPSLPDDAAYVMFTSGSTGQPKGITIPHRAVIRLVRNTNYVQLLRADRMGHMSNCAFDAATFEIWGALLNGSTLVGIEHEAALSPRVLRAQLREQHVTVLFVTTALFNQVVAEAPDAFHTLRVLLFGGEAVDPRWVRSALQVGAPGMLCHVYGPTETTTFATWQHVEDVSAGATNIPIGAPIGNTTAYVLDPVLRPVPSGGTGELYLGGDGLARGYHGQAAATAERFLPDPFSQLPGARMYRTGDNVRWRMDGTIEFIGRFDNQVKIRGFRIEPGEIDRCLQEHPHVRQAATVVRTDSSGARSLVAYYVPVGTAPPDLQQALRRRLRDNLPEYMQPEALQPVPALPLNRNGKLDRSALPDPVPARPDRSDEAIVPPRNEVEQQLAVIWRQVLGVEHIGVNDTFFEIGGHSLRATQLVSRIRRQFGADIPLRAVFENPTIAGQAELLGKHPKHESAGVAEIPRLSREARSRAIS